MTSLGDALADLDRQIAASGSPLGAFLRPGVAADYVAGVFQDVGLTPPLEIIELYSWHDGTDTDAFHAAGWRGPWLFPFATFPSLGAAVEQYAFLLGLNHDDLEIWPSRFFPVFDQSRTHYAVLCDEGAADHGQVWMRELDAPEDRPVFGRLAGLVDAIRGMFADGLYYYDAETKDIQPAGGAYLAFEFEE